MQWSVDNLFYFLFCLTTALHSRAQKIWGTSLQPVRIRCRSKAMRPRQAPRYRHRSYKKQPAEGEDTPAVRMRWRTETDDERSNGNDEMIQSSGERSILNSLSGPSILPEGASTATSSTGLIHGPNKRYLDFLITVPRSLPRT